MAMGKRRRHQGELWVETRSLAKGPGHPFYRRLNQVLERGGFDAFVERACARFYAERMGRPSLPPAVYFRLLLVGYFEGIDSERGIAWRLADSITLREFLGYRLTGVPSARALARSRGSSATILQRCWRLGRGVQGREASQIRSFWLDSPPFLGFLRAGCGERAWPSPDGRRPCRSRHRRRRYEGQRKPVSRPFHSET